MSSEKAKAIERNVTLDKGCNACGSKVNYTLWEKNGQTWYGCSNKIGSQFCKGKPPDDAVRLGAPAQPTHTEGGGSPPPGAPSRPPSSASASEDILDKIADCFAELSTHFSELAVLRRQS